MKTDVRARVSGRRQNEPSALLVSMIVSPTIGLLLGLVVWAYLVRDWKWFVLLIVAGMGIVFYIVSPQLFSIRDDYSEREWRLTTSPPRERARVTGQPPTPAARTASGTTPKIPDRTA
jgi:hypothetical protein